MSKHVMFPMEDARHVMFPDDDTPHWRAKKQGEYNARLDAEKEAEQKQRATCRFCKAESCREVANAFYACKECGKVQ